MDRPRLPSTIAAVTPAWLNAVLVDAPEWSGRTIVSVDVAPIGGNNSLASAVYVANVAFIKRGEVPASEQLLVKLHHIDPDQRDAGAYAAEAWFYRELAARVGTPVPRTYVAEFDERDIRLAIVQEFLRDGWIGSASRSLRIEDLERVLASLVALHARWWNAQELARMREVRAFAPVIRDAIVKLRNGVLDVRWFVDRYRDLVHPAVAGYYATMPGWMEQVADGFSEVSTLIHLDCSAKNLFIPRDPGHDPVLFDWALFRRGNPALDLATLLVYSMDPAEHHRLPNLVRFYHNMLAAKGVRDYPFDTLWNDFRFACLWRMVAAVFNASSGDAARVAHARTIIPLLDSAVTTSRAFDLLDLSPGPDAGSARSCGKVFP